MKDTDVNAHRTLLDLAGSSARARRPTQARALPSLMFVVMYWGPSLSMFLSLILIGVVYPFTFCVITDVFEFLSTISQLVFNLTCLFYVALLDFFWAKQKVIPLFLFIDLLILSLFVVIPEITGCIPDLLQFNADSSFYLFVFIHCFHLEKVTIFLPLAVG